MRRLLVSEWMAERLLEAGDDVLDVSEAAAAPRSAAPAPLGPAGPPAPPPPQQPAPPADEPPDEAPTASVTGGRMRLMRELKDAKKFAGDEESDVDELQRRLIAGHILSESEMERIRSAVRSTT